MQLAMWCLARALIGLAAAAFAAAVVQVAFALAGGGSTAALSTAAELPRLVMLVWLHTLVFSIALALPLIAVAHLLAVRSWTLCAACGIAVALAGFMTQYASEGRGSTILNAYALAAFVTAGLAGGTAYWLAAVCRAKKTPSTISKAL
ncbi:MAG: hypothetical protein WC807_19250 [Hyphomicrobium sp.]|jgi:hypothetical protein